VNAATRASAVEDAGGGADGYRSSHRSRAHARTYDPQFWAPASARALDWDLEQRLLDRILARHLPAAPARALDFACGTGRILRYLESRIADTTGVDNSEEMLAYARARCPDSHLIVHDVTTGAHPDLPTAVDLVTAFRFFLNAEPELRSDVLAWIRSVLGANGTLIANFHLNPRSLRGTYLRLRWLGRPRTPMMSPKQARELLAAAGFEVIAQYGYEYLPYRRDGSHLRAVALRRRAEIGLLDRRRIAGAGGAFVVVARPRCD
jgi:SAM-dependent methyltransferase